MRRSYLDEDRSREDRSGRDSEWRAGCYRAGMGHLPTSLHRICFALLAPLVLAACSTPPAGSQTIPEDGVVAAAVVVGPELGHLIEAMPSNWPVEVRPGRAIILADGSLRADVGPSLGVEDRPGITRHLRRPQLAGLWRRLDELGLGTADAGNFTGNPKLIEVRDREIVQILQLRRGDQDWIVLDRFTVPETDPQRTIRDRFQPDLSGEDPRMRAAIRAIAALAWASDVPPDDTVRFPERYDFGPDPWARYRSQESTTDG